MDLRLGRNWKLLQLVGLIALAVVTVVVSVLARFSVFDQTMSVFVPSTSMVLRAALFFVSSRLVVLAAR